MLLHQASGLNRGNSRTHWNQAVSRPVPNCLIVPLFRCTLNSVSHTQTFWLHWTPFFWGGKGGGGEGSTVSNFGFPPPKKRWFFSALSKFRSVKQLILPCTELPLLPFNGRFDPTERNMKLSSHFWSSKRRKENCFFFHIFGFFSFPNVPKNKPFSPLSLEKGKNQPDIHHFPQFLSFFLFFKQEENPFFFPLVFCSFYPKEKKLIFPFSNWGSWQRRLPPSPPHTNGRRNTNYKYEIWPIFEEEEKMRRWEMKHLKRFFSSYFPLSLSSLSSYPVRDQTAFFGGWGGGGSEHQQLSSPFLPMRTFFYNFWGTLHGHIHTRENTVMFSFLLVRQEWNFDWIIRSSEAGR